MDAWATWYAGNEVNKDLIIWGISIRWWGRIGKALQLVGAFTLTLELIGPRRLAAFDKWAIEKAFPYVIRLYARFAAVVLKSILPLMKISESLQRFSVAARAAAFMASVIVAIYAVAWVIGGSVWVNTGREITEILIALIRILWELMILYIWALGVLIMGVQMALFVPTLFTIAVARFLNHPYSKAVLTFLSIIAIVVGVFFDELTS